MKTPIQECLDTGVHFNKLSEGKRPVRLTDSWYECPRCFQPFKGNTHVDVYCTECGYEHDGRRDFRYLGQRPRRVRPPAKGGSPVVLQLPEEARVPLHVLAKSHLRGPSGLISLDWKAQDQYRSSGGNVKKVKTFRPCRQCGALYDHETFRTCPGCEWISRDLWRRRNREKLRKYQRAWRKANPNKVKAYAKKWNDRWGPMAWYDDRKAGR